MTFYARILELHPEMCIRDRFGPGPPWAAGGGCGAARAARLSFLRDCNSRAIAGRRYKAEKSRSARFFDSIQWYALR